MPYADHEHLHQYGLSIEISTDGISYAFIDDLVELDGFEGERGKADDFTLQTPDQFKLTVPGWQTGSDINLMSFLHKTQHATLLGYFNSRTYPLYFRVTLPKLSTETTATSGTFTGYISKHKLHQQMTAGAEEMFKVAWTVTPRSKVTMSYGS